MDRVKIKEEAKAKIKGKLWPIWKAFLVVGLISLLVTVPGIIAGVALGKNHIVSSILTIAGTLISPIFIVGLTLYIIKFVRNQNYELKDLWKFMPDIIHIFVVSFLVGLSVALGTLLLIIPGIIIGLGLTFCNHILADPDYSHLKNSQILSESWRITKGHKMDIFVFELSFIGWAILSALTFGIVGIYVIPYYAVAHVVYYEQLKNNAK